MHRLLSVCLIFGLIFFDQTLSQAEEKALSLGALSPTMARSINSFFQQALYHSAIWSERDDWSDLYTEFYRFFNERAYGKASEGTRYDLGTESVNAESALQDLALYIILRAYLFEAHNKDTYFKSWFKNRQNWNKDVKPFVKSHDQALTQWSTDQIRIGYALRYMILILGDEGSLLTYFSQPKILEIFKQVDRRFGGKVGYLFRDKLVESVISGERPLLGFYEFVGDRGAKVLGHLISIPPLDAEENCRLESHRDENSISQYDLIKLIMQHREPRQQIANTCYANLAAEMLDVHRWAFALKRSSETIHRKILENDGSFSLDLLSDTEANELRQYVLGDTSAYYVSALYTLKKEASRYDLVNDYDYGLTYDSLKHSFSDGGCPQSVWELKEDAEQQKSEYYKQFDVFKLVNDPDNYNGQTPAEEIFDLFRTYSGLFSLIGPLGGEQKASDRKLFENLQKDPAAVFKNAQQKGLSPKLLQEALLASARMMTCGGAAIRNGEPPPKFGFEQFKNFGKNLDFPEGTPLEIMGRNYKQFDNYNSTLRKLSYQLNSNQFLGVGISVCNGGVAGDMTSQHIVDMDRLLTSSKSLSLYVGYNYNFRWNKYGAYEAKSCGGHTYFLYDMRYNKEFRQCEYKVRNSWGKYKSYPERMQAPGWLELSQDEKFDFWLPSHVLYRNLTDMTIIEPTYD